MEDCNHSKLQNTEIIREFHGHRFNATTMTCIECGAELWDNELTAKFQKWISELGVKPRIQFQMSKNASDCLDKFLENYPSANKTIMIRAMIAIYLELMKAGPEFNNAFNQIFSDEIFSSFEFDDNTSLFGTDVKAIFFLDIQSWARTFNVKPNELAAQAFYLMMAMSVAKDDKLKEFWQTVVLPRIETFAKAA